MNKKVTDGFFLLILTLAYLCVAAMIIIGIISYVTNISSTSTDQQVIEKLQYLPEHTAEIKAVTHTKNNHVKLKLSNEETMVLGQYVKNVAGEKLEKHDTIGYKTQKGIQYIVEKK